MGRNEARNWGINLVDKISSIERSYVWDKASAELRLTQILTPTLTHSRSHAAEKLQRIHKANWWSFSCGICTTWRVRCQTDRKGRAPWRSTQCSFKFLPILILYFLSVFWVSLWRRRLFVKFFGCKQQQSKCNYNATWTNFLRSLYRIRHSLQRS